jgi:hypothetical protein
MVVVVRYNATPIPGKPDSGNNKIVLIHCSKQVTGSGIFFLGRYGLRDLPGRVSEVVADDHRRKSGGGLL